VLDEQFVETFFSSFHLYPGHKNNVEEKSYPAMDLPFMEKLMVQISSQ